MSIFEYVTGTMMLIVGLGVTRLLSGLVDRFRDRDINKPHWIPLAWALLVFVFQMQFLWAAFELNSLIETWSVTTFVFILVYALTLFVAGVLVVPRAVVKQDVDAFSHFLKDGRWALPVLAFMHIWAFLINPVLFRVPVFDLRNLLDFLGVAIIMTTFFSRAKRWWAVGTILYVVYDIIMIVLITPGQYK
ncbi:MAG: hypothetical protein KAI08_07665 [Bacteroidales bacterium]|nr:hypothetical protein [Bacteroidales bacterium]